MQITVIKRSNGKFDIINELGEGMFDLDLIQADYCMQILKPDFMGFLESDFIGESYKFETDEDKWDEVF